MGDQLVWMYWETLPGSRRAPYLDLCHDTVRRYAGDLNLQVLDENSVFDWLPEIEHDLWVKLPGPNYRSDYARTRLVHKYGGLWLDFDCIIMSPLQELFEPLARHDLVGWGRELEGRFYSNLFAARPGCGFVGEWLRAQDDALQSSTDWNSVSWAALAQEITWPIARRTQYHALPMERVAPVPWYAWRRFLSRLESPMAIMRHFPVAVMLWNKELGPVLGSMPRDQILRRRMLLSRLLRIALGKASVEEEIDGWSRLHPLSEARFSSQGRRIELHSRRILESIHSRMGNRSRRVRDVARR